MSVSRSIPNRIKRKVRQECGFGCVLCGHPIFEYDHVVPYANVRTHSVENIRCLCPQHHAEKTRKLIPVRAIEESRLNPFNLRGAGISTRPFYFSGTQCHIAFGSLHNLYKIDWRIDKPFDRPYIFTLLIIQNEPLVNLKFGVENVLLIDMFLKNHEDELVVAIFENELVFKTDFWDIEFVGRRFSIRNGNRDILLDMRLNLPDAIYFDKAEFWNKGSRLLIKDSRIITRTGGGIDGGLTVNGRYGIIYNSEDKFDRACFFFTD